jgi:hypothetical protein
LRLAIVTEQPVFNGSTHGTGGPVRVGWSANLGNIAYADRADALLSG